jgi:predicted  nucleic acid-binding Zn-ribbon protein
MRECIVCGQKWENGNEGLIYDYCKVCFSTDLKLLHKRQKEQKKKERAVSESPEREKRQPR